MLGILAVARCRHTSRANGGRASLLLCCRRSLRDSLSHTHLLAIAVFVCSSWSSCLFVFPWIGAVSRAEWRDLRTFAPLLHVALTAAATQVWLCEEAICNSPLQCLYGWLASKAARGQRSLASAVFRIAGLVPRRSCRMHRRQFKIRICVCSQCRCAAS
jgi:hypothetical protein